VLAGGKPVFVDVDEDSQNITAETIAPAINPKTRAILAVHLAGWPCDMPGIMRLAEKHGLRVVEDCAQAHGAAINGKRVGSFGAIAAFSFCQDKIMTTAGEGGMLITSDDELWSKAWSFKDHGKSYELSHTPQARPGFRWLHETVGSNYRMTELQAAIGRIQLRKLDGWVRRRRENAARLIKALEDIPAIRMPRPPDDFHHAYYKLYAFIRPERLKPDWSRDRILNALEKSGAPALSGSCPEIYREPAFAGHDYPGLPAAERLGETSLMFLVHPTLSNDDIDHIVAITRQVLVLAAE
jgi:dTDP-4-amino-4,6-dideoxygalactose transaminase